MFRQLSGQRAYSDHGPQRLSWEAIDAYLRRAGEDPEPWEVEALTVMDAAYCSAMAGEIRADMARRAPRRS